MIQPEQIWLDRNTKVPVRVMNVGLSEVEIHWIERGEPTLGNVERMTEADFAKRFEHS